MFLYHRATCGASAASGAREMDFISATSALVGRALHEMPHHQVTAKDGHSTAHTGRRLDNGSTRARHHTAWNEHGACPTDTKRFPPKKKKATKRPNVPHRRTRPRRGRGQRWIRDAPIDKAGRRQEVIELGNTRRRVQVRKGRHVLDRQGGERTSSHNRSCRWGGRRGVRRRLADWACAGLGRRRRHVDHQPDATTGSVTITVWMLWRRRCPIRDYTDRTIVNMP